MLNVMIIFLYREALKFSTRSIWCSNSVKIFLSVLQLASVFVIFILYNWDNSPYLYSELGVPIFRNRSNIRYNILLFLSEKAMAPHSSTLAWRVLWTKEPGRLQSMGSLRVRHDWVTSLSLFTFMHWRRKWQPTPVFLPEESQGRGSLVGCRLWGRTESDMTEAT